MINEIAELEVNNIIDLNLENKRNELEKLREDKMNGVRIRSRANWLKDGERASKFFCNLEKYNFTEKTIKKLKVENGTNIYDQKLILKEIKSFYEKLFAQQNSQNKELNLRSAIENYSLPQLNESDMEKLEGKLMLTEISEALLRMKNEKSPGIDGFPSEFYKTFWAKLKYIIMHALNESYDNGILSTTLRHGLITCLPKGQKPREFIKNWRPITLLSVVYKIASAAIANRLKPILEKIIPNNQTGFLKGRNISDCTRLVYDIMYYAEKENIPGLLLLVDFEKAFDSISWSFLNECLKILGFGTGFIRWINTLNKEVYASVLQCGYLSDPIQIGRGCRQGDPIAPYLFIICSFFLTVMIDQNKLVKGIKLGNDEVKIIQFADDTTIFLDGMEGSLQNTLNIIEIFGTYSGLKMNKDKSELIWFGKKKHTKAKLCKNTTLSWGQTEFKLLGITFSTNLDDIPTKNYEPLLQRVSKVINSWKKRILSPIGKIIVLKTIILSKFVHLFQSLPPPPDNLVKQITKIMFSFVWDGKPDKISRRKLVQNKEDGGLEMIDLMSFIKGLQINWIKRLVGDQNPMWKKVSTYSTPSKEKLICFGSLWAKKRASQTKNPFWNGVLNTWVEYLNKYNSNLSPEDKESVPLWFNPNISKHELFLPNWWQKGVSFVSDIMNLNGGLMSKAEIESNYNIKPNFLEYMRVHRCVKPYIGKEKKTRYGPIYPSNALALRTHLKGTKKFRIVLAYEDKGQNQNLSKKWDEKLNVVITEKDWPKIFKICFNTIKDNNLVWLQYRIIHRILGTLSLRKKMGNCDSNICRLCQQSEESIEHIFVTCTHANKLWEDIRNYSSKNRMENVSIKPEHILLGELNKKQRSHNILYLIAKHYLFDCAKKKRSPNFQGMRLHLKNIYNEQQFLSKLTHKEELFDKQWQIIEHYIIN